MINVRNIIIGGAAAFAIAAAPLATPKAQASDKFDGLAIGILAAALIGIAAHEHKKSKREKVITHRNTPKVVYNQHHKKKHVHRTNRKPKRCLRKKWTNHGWKTYYGKSCLAKANKKFAHVHKHAKHGHRH